MVTIDRRRGATGVWANFATMNVQNVWGQAVLGMDLFSILHKKAANLRHEAVDPQNVKKSLIHIWNLQKYSLPLIRI